MGPRSPIDDRGQVRLTATSAEYSRYKIGHATATTTLFSGTCHLYFFCGVSINVRGKSRILISSRMRLLLVLLVVCWLCQVSPRMRRRVLRQRKSSNRLSTPNKFKTVPKGMYRSQENKTQPLVPWLGNSKIKTRYGICVCRTCFFFHCEYDQLLTVVSMLLRCVSIQTRPSTAGGAASGHRQSGQVQRRVFKGVDRNLLE